ncbi:hypothetical protein ACWD5Q_08100 [Streptomyces sp. NPDC002513]
MVDDQPPTGEVALGRNDEFGMLWRYMRRSGLRTQAYEGDEQRKA